MQVKLGRGERGARKGGSVANGEGGYGAATARDLHSSDVEREKGRDSVGAGLRAYRQISHARHVIQSVSQSVGET